MTVKMKIQGSGKKMGKEIEMVISQLADNDGQELFHKDKGSLLYQLEAEEIADMADVSDAGEGTAIEDKKLGVNA
jgi:hypothetical protein